MIERVVFDTHIWISGLLWRGKPYQCLLLARSDIVQLVHCSPMMAELAQKLRTPFGFTENRLQAVLYDYRRMSHQVDITGNLYFVGDDPDDDKFVECALVAGASLMYPAIATCSILTSIKAFVFSPLPSLSPGSPSKIDPCLISLPALTVSGTATRTRCAWQRPCLVF